MDGDDLKCKHHLYISQYNPRAVGFVDECSGWLAARAAKAAKSKGKDKNGRRSSTAPVATAVSYTQTRGDLEHCEAMLCYLNGLTWTSGATSAKFAQEIALAMGKGIPILLAHEMPGVGGQDEKEGIAFGTFFAPDATPIPLIKAGIYATIAVAFKGGTWREASHVIMAQTLAAKPTRSAPKDVAIAKQTVRRMSATTSAVPFSPRRSEAVEVVPFSPRGDETEGGF